MGIHLKYSLVGNVWVGSHVDWLYEGMRVVMRQRHLDVDMLYVCNFTARSPNVVVVMRVVTAGTTNGTNGTKESSSSLFSSSSPLPPCPRCYHHYHRLPSACRSSGQSSMMALGHLWNNVKSDVHRLSVLKNIKRECYLGCVNILMLSLQQPRV